MVMINGKTLFLLILNDLAGFLFMKNDFLLAEELTKVYNYENIAFFFNKSRYKDFYVKWGLEDSNY